MSFIKSSPNPKECSTPVFYNKKPSKETTNLINKINLIKNMIQILSKDKKYLKDI